MRYIPTIVLALFISGCAFAPSEFTTTIGKEKTILRVSVKFVGYFDHTEDEGCNDQDASSNNTICIPWNFWHKYKGKVIETIQGEYTSKYITFVYLQHSAYIDAVTKDWYISLDGFDDPNQVKRFNTKYFVVDHASEYFGKEKVDELLNGG